MHDMLTPISCSHPHLAIHFWWQALCTPYLLRLKSAIYTWIQTRRGMHTAVYTPTLSSLDIFVLGAVAKCVGKQREATCEMFAEMMM